MRGARPLAGALLARSHVTGCCSQAFAQRNRDRLSRTAQYAHKIFRSEKPRGCAARQNCRSACHLVASSYQGPQCWCCNESRAPCRRKLRPTGPLSVQDSQLMLKGSKLKVQRGAAAKTEDEKRNSENRPHDRDGTAPAKITSLCRLCGDLSRTGRCTPVASIRSIVQHNHSDRANGRMSAGCHREATCYAPNLNFEQGQGPVRSSLHGLS